MNEEIFYDHATISKLTQGVTLARAEPKIIYEVPQVVPTGQTRQQSSRRVYNDIQLKEALALAAKIGAPEAAKLSGVKLAMIYKFAQRQDQKLGRTNHGQTKLKRKRLKYSEEKLKEVFGRAVTWHINSGRLPRERVGMSICIKRAAERALIDPNYLLALYTNRNPILGFHPSRPTELYPPQPLTNQHTYYGLPGT
jgi:hypothetical protein